MQAGAVIVCAGPALAASLVPASAALAAAARDAVPVRAACLDLALQSLPRPRARFALGVDRPLYFSVHSGAGARWRRARAPWCTRCATSTARRPTTSAERELEALCDRMQPGWRERVVERRFLPRMIVTHDLPRARRRRAGRRAPVAVADAPGVYVAGDWVGPEGMLADAVVASAVAAAAARRRCDTSARRAA